MHFSTISDGLEWVVRHGYALMFLLMLAEGPFITAVGAFAAALGFFNIWAVLGLSILGNLIPDVIFYAIGYWGRGRFVDRYGKYVGLTEPRVIYFEAMLHRNAVKALFVIKLVPLLATPGLIVVGLTRMDVWKYVKWCAIITVPSSLLYLIAGYYFGAAYDSISRYAHIGGYALLAFVIVFAAVTALRNRLSGKVAKKMAE